MKRLLFGAALVWLTCASVLAVESEQERLTREAAERLASGSRAQIVNTGDAETAADGLAGGTAVGVGSTGGNSGYLARSSISASMRCAPGAEASTRWGTLIRMVYCDSNAAQFAVCNTPTQFGRSCRDSDFTSTPLLYEGNSYSLAGVSIRLNECEGPEGSCSLLITEQHGRSGSIDAMESSGRAQAGENSQLQAQRAARESSAFQEGMNRNARFVNENNKVIDHYQATGEYRSTADACYNGVCGRSHGFGSFDAGLPGCTSQCTATEVQSETYTQTCKAWTPSYHRFCQTKVRQHHCTLERQYSEHICLEGEDCPQASQGGCWLHSRERVFPEECPAGFDDDGEPCERIDRDTYYCDKPEDPLFYCDAGSNGAGCEVISQSCTAFEPNAPEHPVMGQCLSIAQQRECKGPTTCLDNSPVTEGDENCTPVERACIFDSNDRNEGCFIAIDDGSDQAQQRRFSEPNGDSFCTCEGAAQRCVLPPDVEQEEPPTDCQPLEEQGCSFQSQVLIEDEEGGELYYLRTYSCTQPRTVCTAYEQSCGGVDQSESNNATNRDRAAEGIATLREVLGDARQGGAGGSIDLFGGGAMDCKNPRGETGLTDNCCRLNIRAPGEALLNQCDSEDVQIAEGRRTNRAIEMPRYCSNSVKIGFIRICIEYTSAFCVFDSPLAKEINQQGRQQLAGASGSWGGGGSGSAQQSFEFNYFADTPEQGRWSTPALLSGTRFAYYQWPGACVDANDAALRRQCPEAAPVYIAGCSSNCGALPADPRSGAVSGTNWQIVSIPRDEVTTTSLGPNLLASGSCPTYRLDGQGVILRDGEGRPIPNTQCAYRVSATAAFSGGRANVVSEMAWPLYNTDDMEAQSVRTGGYTITGYGVSSGSALDGTLPASVTVEINDEFYSIPTNVPSPTQVSLAGGAQLTYYGNCSVSSRLCVYHFIVPVQATVGPYCTTSKCKKDLIDCSGFSPAEFALLDLGGMDLSNATDHFGDGTESADVSRDRATIISSINTASSSGQAGLARASGSPGAVLTLSPDAGRPWQGEGVDYWETTLRATTRYPTPNDTHAEVDAIVVNWGDGTIPQRYSAGPLASHISVGHRYYKEINGADARNRTYYITVSFETNEGTYSVNARARSYWDDNDGSIRGTDAVGSSPGVVRVDRATDGPGVSIPPRPPPTSP